MKVMMKLLKQINWIHLVNRPETPLFHSYTNSANYEYFNEATGVNWKSTRSLCIDNNKFWDKEEYERLRNVVIDGFRKKPDFFQIIAKRTYKYCRKMYFISRDIQKKNFDNATLSELAVEFKKFDAIAKRMFAFLLIMVPINEILSNTVKEMLERKTSNIDKYYKILTYPKKYNTHTEEELSILKIAIRLKSDKKLFDSFMHSEDKLSVINKSKLCKPFYIHLKKYQWIGARNLWDTAWTESDLIERLNLLARSNPKNEYEHIKEIHVENEIESVNVILELSIKGAEHDLIKVAQEYAFLRTYRTDVMHHSGFLIKNLLDKIAFELGLTYRELVMMSNAEISESIERAQCIIPEEEIKERLKDFATVFLDGKYTVISGKELEVLKKEMGHLLNVPQVTEFSGNIAYSGKLTGKAKIVNSQFDLNKVNENDVMVTAMTFPNYITAMEKASAFITDEGGILCHAAIIAREMKKPCIIGTKIATKVLKDGDLVEVDADKGIVKIIKKA